ncbi:VOC family protein [Falsiroseomonas selenitidurans]|uniref:Bleomycin resistance protein n=1 Tax=Falsiroseomonas selenitidurans TaxID=2716335 RepID=A0ABX1E9M2_9PROT|nr:VOC family protein [Falsiroseomonas selenitidurans]NKC33887.1 bleomycin resistance protein [Falsiroseomonas selenitidurans]
MSADRKAPPGVLGVHHTSFTVSSLDRAVALWTEVFGFPLLSRAPRDNAIIAEVTGVPGADVEIAYVRGPGHDIELIEFRGPADRAAVRPRPCDAGFSHVALMVTGLDALLARGALHGAHPVNPPVTNGRFGPIAGARIAYLRDPDGITIELIECREDGVEGTLR